MLHKQQYISHQKYEAFCFLLCYCFIGFRAFVPLEAPPGQNSTQWEKVQYLFEELGSSRKYSIFVLFTLFSVRFYFLWFFFRLVDSFQTSASLFIIITPLKPHSLLISIHHIVLFSLLPINQLLFSHSGQFKGFFVQARKILSLCPTLLLVIMLICLYFSPFYPSSMILFDWSGDKLGGAHGWCHRKGCLTRSTF